MVRLAQRIGEGVANMGRLKELIGKGGVVLRRRGDPVCGFNLGRPCAPPPSPIHSGREIFLPWVDKFVIVHELAHIIDWNSGTGLLGDDGFSSEFPRRYAFDVRHAGFSPGVTKYAATNAWEYWADAVTAWVYGREYDAFKHALWVVQEDFLHHALRGK